MATASRRQDKRQKASTSETPRADVLIESLVHGEILGPRSKTKGKEPSVSQHHLPLGTVDTSAAPTASKTAPASTSSRAASDVALRDTTNPLLGKLETANHEIIALHDELVAERNHTAGLLLRMRQDMMLDLVIEREKVEEQTKQAARMLRERDKALDTQTSLVAETRSQLDLARSKLNLAAAKAQASAEEAAVYRLESKCLQDTQRTLEEDLAQLREIENEDRAKRLQDDMKRSLPPAYGGLDDVEPAYGAEYHDCGTLEVATFKRAIRDTFKSGLHAAAAAARKQRHSNDVLEHARAPLTFFLLMIKELDTAAAKIETVLPHAEQVLVMHSGEWDMKNLNTVQGRPAFVADRCAKLLLDLIAQVLSALDLRPGGISLTIRDRTDVGNQIAHIDAVLLQSLRKSICGTTERLTEAGMSQDALRAELEKAGHARMWAVQRFHWQIPQLQRSFAARVKLSAEFLGATAIWLEDVVETERQLDGRVRLRVDRACSPMSAMDGSEYMSVSSDGDSQSEGSAEA